MFNYLKADDEPVADPPAREEARQLLIAAHAAKLQEEQKSSKGPCLKRQTGVGVPETESDSSSSGSRPQSTVKSKVQAIDRQERQAARRER